MKKLLALSLGILSAIGGFVDIGDFVFNSQAGARFGYSLLWAVVVGLIGIALYSEMCGRVAAASKRGVFDLIRERLGYGPGMVTLVAAQLVNVLTLAAEVGGVAIVLQLVFGGSSRLLAIVAVLLVGGTIWFLSFGIIERLFSYLGLCLVVFAIVALRSHPDGAAALSGLVPSVSGVHPLLFLYFMVGIIGSAMSPYEVYFYSSGAVEEGWGPGSMFENRINAFLGFGLGALLSVSIIVVAAEYFYPAAITPTLLSTPALAPALDLGRVGLVVALVGILFAVGGAAVESCMAGAYNMAQFFGWPWGKYHRPRRAARFSLAWMAMLVAACLILLTGVNPVQVTEVSVILSVVVLPLTYLPLLIVANDGAYMGRLRNGRLANVAGGAFLVVILIVAVAALPLYIVTGGGTSG